MDLSIFGGAVSSIANLVSKWIPDRTQEEQNKFIEELTVVNGQIAAVQGQIDTNKLEAASPSTFVAGWRPMVGWVGAVSLGLAYIPKEIVLTILWGIGAYHTIANGSPLPQFPDLGITDLLGLLGSLLGFGALRSMDKVNGVAAK
jgi:hypothetical protein